MTTTSETEVHRAFLDLLFSLDRGEAVRLFEALLDERMEDGEKRLSSILDGFTRSRDYAAVATELTSAIRTERAAVQALAPDPAHGPIAGVEARLRESFHTTLRNLALARFYRGLGGAFKTRAWRKRGELIKKEAAEQQGPFATAFAAKHKYPPAPVGRE